MNKNKIYFTEFTQFQGSTEYEFHYADGTLLARIKDVKRASGEEAIGARECFNKFLRDETRELA